MARFARAKVHTTRLASPAAPPVAPERLVPPSQIIIEKELEALFRARVSERATQSRWLHVFRRMPWRKSRSPALAGATAELPAERRKQLLEIMTPRWLHVLVPAKPDMSKEADTTTELRKVATLQAQLGREGGALQREVGGAPR